MVIGDFDGDRAVDAAREVDGGIVVALAQRGGFHDIAAPRAAQGDQRATQLLPAGDLDGDGRDDILALVVGASAMAGEPKVLPRERAPRLVLLRGARGGLSPPEPVASLDGWWSDLGVAAGDLDGDHRPDVALAGMRDGKTPTPTLAMIRGELRGPGTAISWSIPVPGVPARIAIADVDGDGVGELLAFGTSTAPSSWSVWSRTAGGAALDRRQSWTDPSGNRQSWFGRAAAVGRFDGNTVEVAVAAPGAGTIYLYRAGASAADRTLVGGAAGSSFGDRIAAVDLNGDGRDELVVFTDREIVAFGGARGDAVLARQPLSR